MKKLWAFHGLRTGILVTLVAVAVAGATLAIKAPSAPSAHAAGVGGGGESDGAIIRQSRSVAYGTLCERPNPTSTPRAARFPSPPPRSGPWVSANCWRGWSGCAATSGGRRACSAAERKRPLPFLPSCIGLICGRDSAAQRDVQRNAARRWPAVRFRVEQVAVQGSFAVADVVDALQRLDADPAVDVIVIARGGGSIEDLLPFSDETLIRAVAACRTPVVSAIGHEQDTPLLDLVADVRASTPTDAARRVVPDVAEQLVLIAQLRSRARRIVEGGLDRERAWFDGILSRPVLRRSAAEIRPPAGAGDLTGRARPAVSGCRAGPGRR